MRLVNKHSKGKLLKIGDASKKLNVSTQTLRDWTDAGKVQVKLSDSGHRSYYEADVNRLMLEEKGLTGYWVSSLIVAIDVHGSICYANSDSYELSTKVEVEFISFKKYWDFNNGLQRQVHNLVLDGKPAMIEYNSDSGFPFNGTQGNTSPLIAVAASVACLNKEDCDSQLVVALDRAKKFLKENFTPQITYVWVDKTSGEVIPY